MGSVLSVGSGRLTIYQGGLADCWAWTLPMMGLDLSGGVCNTRIPQRENCGIPYELINCGIPYQLLGLACGKPVDAVVTRGLEG